MKPLFIDIEGFGAYHSKQRVTFTALEDLFVISGETGSGKTTIFDALTYALYGSPLGTRDASMVRSSKCTDKENTLVRFRFEITKADNTKEIWEVDRSPFFRAPKSRGDGLKKASERCVLVRIMDPDTGHETKVFPDGKKTTTAINTFIEENLIHLNYDNFSKILILPQGEFQRFLEEKSAERGKILERIFPVRSHQALMDSVKAKCKDFKQRIGDMEKSLLKQRHRVLNHLLEESVVRMSVEEFKQEVSEHRLSIHSELKALQDSETNSGKALQGVIALREQAERLLQKSIERDARAIELNQLEEEREQNVQWNTALNKSRKAKHLVPLYTKCVELSESIVDKKHEIETNQSELKTAEVRLGVAKVNAGTVSSLRDDLDVVKLEAKELTEIAAKIQQYNSAHQKLEQKKSTLKDVQKGLTATNERVLAAQIEVLGFEQLQLEKENIQRVLDEAQRKHSTLKVLDVHAEDVRTFVTKTEPQFRQSISVEQEAQKVLQQKADETRRQLRTLIIQKSENAASLLAQQLIEEQPCPVCGSCDHPLVAPFIDGIANIDFIIKTQEECVQTSQQLCDEKNRLILQLEITFRDAKNRTEKYKTSLKEKGFEGLKDFKQAFEKSKSEQNSLEKQRKDLVHRLNQLPRRKKELQKLQATLDVQETHKRKMEQEVHKNDGEVATLLQQLGSDFCMETSPNKILIVQKTLEESQLALQKRIDQFEKESSNAQIHWTKATTTLDEQEKQHKDLIVSYEKSHNHFQTKLELSEFSSSDEVRLASLSIARENSLQEEVDQWTKKLAVVRDRLQTLNAELDNKPLVNIDELKAQEDQASLNKTESTEQRTKCDGRLRIFQVELKQYDKEMNEYSRVKSKVGGIVELNDMIHGTNLKRVKLKDWVLGRWLDQVLSRANIRLNALSNERYIFSRRTENSNRALVSGLDIDVIDSQSNFSRDVRTLSGGEKFLASISLALGLSDVIQMQSGAVRLDTLFIDEGFGSLSDEYRELVLQALAEIGGTRQVGVISHVPEVKNFISCRVDVQKSPNGSTISMH